MGQSIHENVTNTQLKFFATTINSPKFMEHHCLKDQLHTPKKVNKKDRIMSSARRNSCYDVRCSIASSQDNSPKVVIKHFENRTLSNFVPNAQKQLIEAQPLVFKESEDDSGDNEQNGKMRFTISDIRQEEEEDIQV